MNAAPVSLCVVVKNEALFLRRCLLSARPYVREMIVVDTGSGDTTVEIAEAAGARVFREPWPGDLAAAHDLPVAHAREPWILTLDGDEALEAASGAALGPMIGRAEADGYVAQVRNYSFHSRPGVLRADSRDPRSHGAGFWFPSRNVRLYRNDGRFRHEGRLHQTPRHSIERHGGVVAASDLLIHHYGFLRWDRIKTPLYLDLAARQLADGGRDWKSLVELGVVLADAGRLAEAESLFREACDARASAETATFRARCLLALGRAEDAWSVLEPWVDAATPGAQPVFTRPGEIDALAAAVALARGDAATAIVRARRADGANPGALAERVSLVEALRTGGAVDEALQVAGALCVEHPGQAEAWEARGIVELVLGRDEDAVRSLGVALDIDPWRAFAAYNLGIALDRAGRRVASLRTLHAAACLDHERRLGDAFHARFGGTGDAHGRAVTPLGENGVLLVVPDLSGGAARVLVQQARALQGVHPVAVASMCNVPFTGERHDLDLADLGVAHHAVADSADLAKLQRALRPSVVVHRWGPSLLDLAPRSYSGERLVCASDAPLPAPEGYDRYVTLSPFQQGLQRPPPERTTMIPNGVEIAQFDACPPDERHWNDGPRGAGRLVRVAMASRLAMDKVYRRLPMLLAAAGTVPFAVRIAGRGARRYEIEPELAQYALQEHVRFVGVLPQRDVPGFLRAADIGLHVTETAQESHVLVVLQMMAAGLPIVAQPRGCLPELVAHGENGLLCDDEAELAAAIAQLVASTELRSRMGRASRQRVARYDVARFDRAWRQLIAEECAQAAVSSQRST